VDEPFARPGVFSRQLSLGRASSFGRRRPSRPPAEGPTIGSLRVVVVCARSLPAMDKSGTSDPFVALTLTHGLTRVKRKTTVIAQSLNPIWNEAFDFGEVPHDAKLTLDVWDKDSLGNDFIGKATVLVAELPPDAGPLARWLDLPRGEVLVELSYSTSVPPKFSSSSRPAHSLTPPPPPTVEVLSCTWNVGNALPPAASELRQWLDAKGAGLVAIGSQECSFKATPAEFASSGDFWFSLLHEALGGPSEYELVAANSLGQMHLGLFVAVALLPHVTSVEVDGEATGLAHVLGNKGGLAVCCDVAGTSVCLVSAHLAAHQSEIERRGSDFAEIEAGVTLRRQRHVDLSSRFELLVWMGDLNYRIDLEREAVLNAVRDRDWPTLRAHDQLTGERDAGAAFVGFREGPLSFPPTFKHVHGVGPLPVPGGPAQRLYESKKMRVPSWCDRILWREWPGKVAAELLSYESVPTVCTSDHTPVSARLCVQLASPPPRLPEPAAREQFACVLSGLRVSALRPTDAGKNASADPYVRVALVDGLGAPVCSSAKKRSLEPRWSEALTVKLPWAFASAEAVQGARLFVSVMDKDLLTADGSLGHAVVAIGSAWPARVRVMLTRHGKESGELSFVLHVRRRPLGRLRGDAWEIAR